MRNQLRRVGLLVKASLFTVVIHGMLIAFLFYGFSWNDNIRRGGIKPIQAVAVPDPDIAKQQAAKKLEDAQRARDEAARKKKEQQEQKQRDEEAHRKAEAEKKRVATNKRKADEQKKKQEAEASRKVKAEKQKREAEKKRKAEAEKKRETKRLADEKKLREQALREQLAQEKTQSDAENALSELIGRIKFTIENNWRRPNASRSGLTATIRVKVARDGQVISVRIIGKGSGDPLFDQSAELAVRKASPLPFPTNPQYYEFINEFNLKFSPD